MATGSDKMEMSVTLSDVQSLADPQRQSAL
jgi:hypothetical protein